MTVDSYKLLSSVDTGMHKDECDSAVDILP